MIAEESDRLLAEQKLKWIDEAIKLAQMNVVEWEYDVNRREEALVHAKISLNKARLQLDVLKAKREQVEKELEGFNE